MSQQTNLNVAPYFDDFNPNNDYHRVLFKPGYPVQARELTTLQSILQNQIERFGQHFFKEGAKVIPGNTGYNGLYYAIQLQNNYLGIPVAAYIDQLVGAKITGQTSGVTAVVDKVLLAQDSERGNLTLYINYLSSNTQNNSTQQFSDGELLTSNITISSGLLGNTVIQSGEPFAITLANGAAAVGSSFNISEGVYFIRGNFVNVGTETLILDQYSNTPNYRIGLYINEEIITSDIDETLTDNSQGENNYAAPGADRLKISTFLFKKSLTDFDDNNFIELATINDGNIRTKTVASNYNLITDELARRTYAESGDYVVSPFDISVKDSLNNNKGNRGIFNRGQFTYGGATPSDNLALYQVSPGKAFVRGYEVDIISTTFLDVPKPRTVKTLTNQSIVYNTGPTLKLNRVLGAPQIGLGNTYVVSLRDQRVGSAGTTASGKEIGVARVYDFKLESGLYETANKNLNEWHVSLFDIQTFTNIHLNNPITLTVPTYIKGNNSGASGFLRNSITDSRSLTIYDVKGKFIPNESLVFDGIESGVIGVAVTAHGISDVKSLYGKVGSASTFNADVIQSPRFNVGIATVGVQKYFVNEELFRTTLTSTVGVGSTVIYLDTNQFSLNDIDNISISIGNSITAGTGTVTNAPIVSIGDTFVRISQNSAIGLGTSFVTTLTNTVGFGSDIIFVDSSTEALTIGSSITVGTALTTAPIVAVGDTFVKIGAAFTSTSTLQTTVSSTVGVGSTSIFVGIVTGVVAGVSRMSVGTALTNVTIVSIGDTFVNIGTGNTSGVTISAGVAVTFNNVSSMITGTAVTFTRVSQLVIGDEVIISNPLFTSTVKSPNTLFPGSNRIFKNNLVTYSDVTLPDPVVARVVSVGTTSIEVTPVQTVSGITSSILPSSSILDVTDFKVINTDLESSLDNTLYTKLPKNNVSAVDLSSGTLTIRKSFTVNISGNQLSANVTAGTNETFAAFDVERYSLIRSNGEAEVLTADRFAFIAGGTQLQIYNLGGNDTGATLTATLEKINPKSKVKRRNRVNSVLVNNSKYEGSGIGATTLNDGLVFGNYPYGTRVQDENISLNTADIIEIHGIYESADTTDPSPPKAVLSSLTSSSSTTQELIIGEELVGQTSGAIAVVAEKLTSSQISFIYKNQNTFNEGETLIFSESAIRGQIVTLETPSFDVSFNYTYNNGQSGTQYGYGYLTRKSDSSEPVRKIKVYFSNGYYDATDDGDVTTASSYDTFDYSLDIPNVDNTRVSDIIDIRPRVSNYVTSEGNRSPLEFYGRTFDSTGNSSTSVLASDETLLTTFSFYLGRIDRIYLGKDGKLQVKYGEPSERPEKPVSVDDSLEIATINLPPYLYDTSQASIEFLEHKRYRMVDIKQLENRIKNLEYYTTLSLLESNTANLFVPDADGLNRFKSGFFVDNFSSFLPQENKILIRNSVDTRNKELRPSHYTTSIDLIEGPVVGVDPTADLAFGQIEGINVRKTGDVLTLDYAEVEWLKQTFATRSESVTPFLISFWQGTIELTPATDTWIDTTRLEAKIINAEGNYAETLANAATTLNVDPQTGFAPTVWNAWVTNWTGQDVITTTRNRTQLGDATGWGGRAWWGTVTDTTFEDTFTEVRDTGVTSRTGVQTIVTEQFDQTSVGDRVVRRDLVPYMRSRNVQFISKKVKPLTRLYAFFDGVDVTRYCVPKLLEITMLSGVFQVGETVTGYVQQTGLGQGTEDTSAKITFRVAQSNHKEGPYNIPATTFPQNPYNSQILPELYSSTSTILNIDTFSLSNAPQGEFSGWVESGMILVGQSSQAQATINNVRLISDLSATLMGSFYIPNPNLNVYPRFEAGTKTFTLVNDDTNDQNVATTIAEEAFTSSGTLETVQENIISVRNARVENKQVFEEQAVARTTGSQLVSSRVISQTSRQGIVGWYDPLAQSFLVDNEFGVFLTSCDVFFRSKDDTDIPVTFQLRTMQGGFPTQNIIPFSEIILEPNEVNTSGDGSVATNVQFKAPVYLEGGKEYCICLASNSTKYSVYISRIGENDLITQTFISNQPYLGSLFKSQNASTWEASQWEDLKFTLYRADFIESGTAEFYSPQLSEGNGQIAKLMPNPLKFNSQRVRVSLSSTINDPDLTLGNTIVQVGTGASGNYVGNAGIATGTLSITNSGIGYTPSSGSYTYNDVILSRLTGNGSGATANVTISNGVAIAATIVSSGNGYRVGDTVGITTLGSVSVGRDAKFTIVSIANTNQLIIDNIQGDFEVGSANTIRYINNSGITTDLNASLGGGIYASEIITVSDGLHIKVNHKNHGMYAEGNLVTLSGVESDIKPTKLTVSYASDSTGSISVDDATNFSVFEGVGVGTTNPGYLKIGNEIIEYTSVSGNVIGGDIVRGVNPLTYPIGSQVYKYENNGISLRRINKTHNLDDATVENPVDFDYYNIKLDMSSDGTDRFTGSGFKTLYQNETKTSGGYNVKSTQNIAYEIITPIVQNLTVQGTSLSAEARTVTGTSISGNEIAFVDAGFEQISINQPNYLSSPRMICSKINEDTNLGSLSGNKSLNMRLRFNTTNTYLSPVVDTQRVSTILTSNRVNSVITNYATDNRTGSIFNDPTAFQYVSKEITLETPATSVKVILNAYVNSYCDIRAFYSIGENPGFEPIFTPFPGYDNLDFRSQLISLENSSGRPDSYVTPSTSLEFNSELLDYKEYNFTADNLPPFRSYRIKLVATSTNQVYVPRIKDLRVIALA
jgi:hypothetical protein